MSRVLLLALIPDLRTDRGRPAAIATMSNRLSHVFNYTTTGNLPLPKHLVLPSERKYYALSKQNFSKGCSRDEEKYKYK